MFSLRTFLLAVTALLALAPAANATYMLAKAELAQLLIARAWSKSTAVNYMPPWPWADTRPVARLQIKRLAMDSWVLSGANGNALAFGPGLAKGSSQPGSPGVAVIGGHRDTHFRQLQHISLADRVRLQSENRQWNEYQVTSISIADSRTDSIAMESDSQTLVLVTCYPFNALVSGGPLRYVIEAELIQRSEPAQNRTII